MSLQGSGCASSTSERSTTQWDGGVAKYSDRQTKAIFKLQHLSSGNMKSWVAARELKITYYENPIIDRVPIF